MDAALAEDHVGVLTTLRPDGTPHVTPVRFTWDGTLVRVLTVGTARKVRNVRATPRAAICQVMGRRWITLEGVATVRDDPERVLEGARRYAARYGQFAPEPPGRVVVEIAVDRVMSLPR